MKNIILQKILLIVGFFIILCVNVIADSYRPVKTQLKKIKHNISADPVRANLNDRYQKYNYGDSSTDDSLNRHPSSDEKKPLIKKEEIKFWKYSPADD